ncbi:hypothetical protein B0H17DRAFT_1148803 [Mycena rosella]|uniref:Uncharacterized protein n=1 Tax=Mycena rosella TaxID=1033263 RepID=A0AAD7C977_MYCRO|nr:hypothetical protein B0H17DRAFT_1148803 [Mycena rosella]
MQAVGNWAGLGKGTVHLIARRVMTTVLHPGFMQNTVRMPTHEEKEKSKQWVHKKPCRAWRDGVLLMAPWCHSTSVPPGTERAMTGNILAMGVLYQVVGEQRPLDRDTATPSTVSVTIAQRDDKRQWFPYLVPLGDAQNSNFEHNGILDPGNLIKHCIVANGRKEIDSFTPTMPPQLQALVSCIDHLHDLLRNLPTSLPNNPPNSLYNFCINPEILEDGGHFSAVSHALEVSFETHLLHVQGRTINFVECGAQLDTLVKFLKTRGKHMSPGERTTFQESWLERLVTATVDSESGRPQQRPQLPMRSPPVAKKAKPTVVIDVDNDSDSPSPPLTLPPAAATPSTFLQPSMSRKTVIGNPKQLTLAWQQAKPGEVSTYWAKAKEAGAEH